MVKSISALIIACRGKQLTSVLEGNTIFVALGASGQSTKPYSWTNSLLSIGCYSLGTLCFARLNTSLLPPAKRRGTLMTSFFLQTILIVVSVVIIQTGVVDGRVAAQADKIVVWNELIPIALLSFQSAGQIVNSRAMNINEVPTVVVTSLLCDLFSDAAILAPVKANVKRNRRIAGFLLFLVSSIVSGWISKATGRVEPVLWITAGLKLGMTLAWAFWPWMQPVSGPVRHADPT